MSLIIIDDKYYKAAIQSLKSKLNTDKKFNYKDFPVAVDNIPSSADGTDNTIIGIYFLNPDENGYPTKIKVSGWSLENKETNFPIVFSDKMFSKVESVEYLNRELKYFNSSAFQNMQKLRNIVVPNSVMSISTNAFNGCISLTSITIPNSVTSISGYAFGGCTNLTSITIPNSVASISGYAFSVCTSLTSIKIPNSVMGVGNGVFQNCASLQFVELGQGFNSNHLDLSSSTRYSRETIVSWLNALADRTGQTAYKLTIGATNLKKLTEEDIAIATANNWTLA